MSNLSPCLAKIVFIYLRIEKMDLAEESRKDEFAQSRKFGWDEYVYFPSGDRSRIISNEFYRFEGWGGVASWNSNTIALECALVAMTRARVSKLSLSLSLDAYRGPVKEWPPLQDSLLTWKGGSQEIEHPGMGCRKHPLCSRPAYIFLLGSCARMLSTSGHVSHANLT